MKKIFYDKIEEEKITKIFYCPACHTYHTFVYKSKIVLDEFKPTLIRSIKIKDENGIIKCHLNIKDGNIEYLDDCTHDWKGLIVPMREV